jgi:hypothetical protein
MIKAACSKRQSKRCGEVGRETRQDMLDHRRLSHMYRRVNTVYIYLM